MVLTNLQMAPDALVVGAWAAAGRLSFVAGLYIGGAVLSVAELPHGGYCGAAAIARRDVGQPDRLWQSFSGVRVGSDKHAGEVASHLVLVDVFAVLYVASHPAQFRLRHHPPSRHSNQPDPAARRALPARFARLDSAGIALHRPNRDGAALAVVQVSSPVGFDRRFGFGRRRHRRVAGGALAASAPSRAGD